MAFLPTKRLRVHMNLFKRVRAFQIKLEFGSVGFWGEGKTGVPGEKPLGAKERTDNKLNPHMALAPGFEPGPHWWEASALTTAPPLHHPCSPVFYMDYFIVQPDPCVTTSCKRPPPICNYRSETPNFSQPKSSSWNFSYTTTSRKPHAHFLGC